MSLLWSAWRGAAVWRARPVQPSPAPGFGLLLALAAGPEGGERQPERRRSESFGCDDDAAASDQNPRRFAQRTSILIIVGASLALWMLLIWLLYEIF